MAVALLVLSSLIAFTWLMRHRRITLTFRDDPILKPGLWRSRSRPMVSILVPARNEEANIRDCLLRALQLNYQPKEIIVVDDRSEDRTAQIVAELARDHPEISLVRVGSLPEGWTGKTHALWEGFQRARGDWLLFIDADTRHHPDNLDVALGFAEQGAYDLVSLLPGLECGSFWEQLLQPVLGGALMIRFSIKKINNPDSSLAFANGQYILMRRGPYQAVGGHERVRSELLEDIAIAKVLKAARYRIATAYAPDLSTTRMYSTFGEITRGWARIFYYGFGKSLAAVLLGFVLIVVFSIMPFVVAFSSAWRIFSGHGSGLMWALFAVSFGTCLAIYAALWRIFELTRSSRLFIPLYPLAALISAYVMLKAFFLPFSRKGVTWRGTTYAPASPEKTQ